MKRKMQKLMMASVVMVGLLACQGSPEGSRSVDVKPLAGDVMADDTLAVGDKTMQHVGPDGLFDDFMYSFMREKSYQFDRIAFPLIYRVDGKESRIEENEWEFDSIYSEVNEYTVIYDGRESRENVCDSTMKEVTVEVVNLKEERVKLYRFTRQGKRWMLTEIDEHAFDFDNKHQFFAFYGKFANDETFQMEHVHDPFYFKTFDSDNFQDIEGWVSAESWAAYRTYLPNEKLINTIYDDKRPVTDYRTFVIGSPSSGMSCTLLFKRTHGRWELVRMEN